MQYEDYIESRGDSAALDGSEVFVWLQGGVAVKGVLDGLSDYIIDSIPEASDTVMGVMKKYGVTGSNTDGTMDQNSITNAIIGVQDLFIPASAMWPRVTAGCAPLARTEIAGNNLNIQTLDFDQTTQEFAQFGITLPRKYNLGTFTYQVKWSSTVGSGAVTWGLQALALSDGDALNTAFGTAVDINDAVGSASTDRTSAESAAVTIGNTPAAADSIHFQVYRNPSDGSDNLAGDARLEGIWLHITTDAAKDA